MRKISLLSLMVFSISYTAIAQQKEAYIAKPRLSIGAEFAVPSNEGFGEIFKIGFGGSGKFEIPITNKFYTTATAGFTAFYLKEKYKDLTYNKNYIPLKGGAKYYFERYFYAEAEVGASVGANEGAGTAFVWAPGVGVSFPITKDGHLDSGIRYEKWAREGGNISQIGFRVAYKF